MTDPIKKAAREIKDEFYEEFVSPHYVEKDGSISAWNGDKSGYFDEDFVLPTHVVKWIEKKIDLTKQALIKEILDECIKVAKNCDWGIKCENCGVGGTTDGNYVVKALEEKKKEYENNLTREKCFNHNNYSPCDLCTGSTVKETITKTVV